MTNANRWKLADAKAHFSELVRCARAGQPQVVIVHGKKAVLVVDPQRFEVRPKNAEKLTMADFIEQSKKYRGPLKLPRRLKMYFADKPWPGENS